MNSDDGTMDQLRHVKAVDTTDECYGGDELHYYECPNPDCDTEVAEWMDCMACGWYDVDVWSAAVERRKTGASIAMADPLDLEGWR